MIFVSWPKPLIFKLHVALWRCIHLSHYINSQNYRNINEFFVPCAPNRVQNSTNCSCWLSIAIPRMHNMWCCIKKYLSQPVRVMFFFFFLNERSPCESLETCKRDVIFIPRSLPQWIERWEKPCGWSSLAKVHDSKLDFLHSSCYSKPAVCCVFFFHPSPCPSIFSTLISHLLQSDQLVFLHLFLFGSSPPSPS